MTGDPDWVQRRREVADGLAQRLDRVRAAETSRARALVQGFVAQARAAGLRPGPLQALAGDRRGLYRTGLTGWYLTRDGSVGVAQDGAYYDLVAPVSLRSRLRGVRLEPADPPLQVGRGARDGESIALDALLSLRLAAGDEWPIHGR